MNWMPIVVHLKSFPNPKSSSKLKKELQRAAQRHSKTCATPTRGVLGGGVGLETRFLEEACKLRAVCASIVDDAAARMPLSYVHLVQLLVDTLVVLAPFALYPKLGILAVLLSPILVLFYRGFLQLSKSFLDPFGNGDSLSENFSISCLLCETNAGSVRWFNAIQQLPFGTAD